MFKFKCFLHKNKENSKTFQIIRNENFAANTIKTR